MSEISADPQGDTVRLGVPHVKTPHRYGSGRVGGTAVDSEVPLSMSMLYSGNWVSSHAPLMLPITAWSLDNQSIHSFLAVLNSWALLVSIDNEPELAGLQHRLHMDRPACIIGATEFPPSLGTRSGFSIRHWTVQVAYLYPLDSLQSIIMSLSPSPRDNTTSHASTTPPQQGHPVSYMEQHPQTQG
ncbi:hypothetical protein FIBSPDRAFT_885883 [Athelia psychrophila]|uniref:Uncharacterized protein n=1 Tax=Athelia psychrophila TaxID=1759441 RepID=A0A166RIP0_9AGAM|nr:hypothetical protein FIBSPDRAFT_885883 [Fibularhizoctonia sp. CBS 109695]